MDSTKNKQNSNQKYLFIILILFIVCYFAYVFFFDQSEVPLDDMIKNIKSGETPF